MSKITLNDTVIDTMIKMGEGNPGAAIVLMQLMQGKDFHANVDGLLYIFNLDTLGVYGSKIWMLYKDCCNEDLKQLELVLRNHQMGMLSEQVIHEHLAGGRGKPFENLISLDALFPWQPTEEWGKVDEQNS